MLNFFQNPLRKELNHHVFKRQIFEFNRKGKNYRGLIKIKNILGISLKWYQIQGVEFHSIEEINDLKNHLLNQIKPRRTTLCIQIGCVNSIAQFPSIQTSDPDFTEEMKNLRIQNQKTLIELGWNVGARENMPLSTIVIDLQNEQNYNGQTASKIKKAYKHGLTFDIAQEKDWDIFYHVWKQTAQEKGFHIMTQETYNRFVSYLQKNQKGLLVVVKTAEGELVSGSICVLCEKTIMYLYGATARAHGNIGGHQFLFDQLIQRGKTHGYEYLDLFGGAPTGFPEHTLTSVSAFKEGFGGTKIEYLGNYDRVINKLLYRLFVRYQK